MSCGYCFGYSRSKERIKRSWVSFGIKGRDERKRVRRKPSK
jgi:hypothetical protein